MSGLGALLSTLNEERADRVVFAPNDHAYAFSGDRSWPVGRDRISAGALLAAIAELLSNDELLSIPESRPRIVRHEHEGETYVIEVARGAAGIRLGVRLGKASIKRASVREPAAAPVEVLRAREPSVPPPTGLPLVEPHSEALPLENLFDEPEPPPPPRARRAEKRTVRVTLDDEGKPVDPDALDFEGIPAATKKPSVREKPPEPIEHSRLTKEVERPVLGAGRRAVHQTHIIPPAGQPAPTAVITGDPDGAHVTFLLAPGGFTLEPAHGPKVVSRAEDAAVRGELFVAPSMTLRIVQGAAPSIVSYYRYVD